MLTAESALDAFKHLGMDNPVIASKDIDLILMDVQIPMMDGFRTTREIRVWETEQNSNRTPIIALTAHTVEEHHDKCIQNETDD